ncbi:hypothetical protein ACFFRR_006429 [Megaselia abdita]
MSRKNTTPFFAISFNHQPDLICIHLDPQSLNETRQFDMKIAILISFLWTGISSIKIENFDSNGVYFQYKGDLRIQNETLNFVNKIDLDILTKTISRLRDKLNGESQAISDIYTQIASNLNLLSEVFSKPRNDDFTFIANERMIELTGLNNKVKDIIKKVENLKVNDKQMFEKLNDIASKMDFLSQSVSSKEPTTNILPRTYLKGMEHLNRRSLTVEHYRQENLIIISVKVPVCDEEMFELYKVISFPIIENKNIVSLRNEFNHMMISKSRNRYFSVNEDLTSLSKLNGTLMYNDKSEHLILSLGNSPCLYNMFMGVSLQSCSFTSNFTNIEIFERLDQTKFLFAIRDATPYTYSCGMVNNNGKNDQIQGTGFLYLDSFCDFQTKDNNIHNIRQDAILSTKDKYDFNLERFIKKTITSHIKPIPEILPMNKFVMDFDKFNKLSIEMDGLLKKQEDLLKNLFEPLPTDNPEGTLNITKYIGNDKAKQN